MEFEEQKEKEYVDIFPISKWKRFLVFLADAFITFILCFLLYNVAVMPIAKAATSYSQKGEDSANSMKAMHEVLYKNKILFQSKEYSGQSIETNAVYTFDLWLSYHTLDSEQSPDENYPQYGHKIENEVIYNFYHNIRNSDATYLKFFELYNKNNNYFTLQEGNYVLKDTIKAEVKFNFDPRGDMSSTGKTYFDNLKNNLFAPLLSEVFTDIEKNDLTYEGISYKANKQKHDTYVTYFDNLITSTSFISLGLAWSIYYVLIPFIHKSHKTVAMMMMSIERVNIDKLYICKRREMIFSSIYALFTNMIVVFFLPLSTVTINYIFSLNILPIFSLFSLAFNIISLGFILFNAFNRSLSDIFSRSVLITTSNLDAIYRAKGYNV